MEHSITKYPVSSQGKNSNLVLLNTFEFNVFDDYIDRRFDKFKGCLVESIETMHKNTGVPERTIYRRLDGYKKSCKIRIGKIYQDGKWLKNLLVPYGMFESQKEVDRAALMISERCKGDMPDEIYFWDNIAPTWNHINYVIENTRARKNLKTKPRESCSYHRISNREYSRSLQKKKAQQVHLTREGKFAISFLPQPLREADFLSFDDMLLLTGLHENVLRYALSSCRKENNYSFSYFKYKCVQAIQKTNTYADWKHGKDMLAAYKNRFNKKE